MHILPYTVTLFLIMDPLGNIPVFLSELKDFPPQRRRKILIRELFIALIVLLIFLFLGRHLLNFLNLKEEAISVGGGIILFLIALNMIFPKNNEQSQKLIKGEPFIVPLAIPLVAGPTSLAAVLLLQSSDPENLLGLFISLVTAWALSSIILMSSSILFKILRKRGLIAVERLMGMLLVILSVQMFLNGVAQYLHISLG